ncbi:MAG TPA: hypothetical protein VGW34_09975 [Allosphingosinicella sp.]|nr:hypothetical protein [Allosphingosinicella sp.]
MEAAMGMQAAGAIVQGVAGYEAGKYNRAVARANAVNAERDGAAEEARVRDAARLAMGRQIVGQASGGLMPGTGTALDALRESAIEAELDALTIRRRAAAAAAGHRVEGKLAYREGVSKLIGGFFGAAGGVAKGVDYAGGGT